MLHPTKDKLSNPNLALIFGWKSASVLLYSQQEQRFHQNSVKIVRALRRAVMSFCRWWSLLLRLLVIALNIISIILVWRHSDLFDVGL